MSAACVACMSRTYERAMLTRVMVTLLYFTYGGWCRGTMVN